MLGLPHKALTSITAIPESEGAKTSCIFKGWGVPFERKLDVSISEVKDWVRGESIQQAMPRLNATEREFFMTGMDEEAQEKVFGEDDD